MTKIIGFVTHSKKAYVCLMQLHKDADIKSINNVINEFIGEIYQRPPIRSHVKRVLRTKKIFNIEINEINDRKVLLTIESEAGTYMRKLCWDIGLVLGTGAHMRELRRIKTGPFSEDSAVTMQEISEAIYQFKKTGKEDLLRKVIIPGEFSVCELGKILVRDTAVESVINGSPLAVPGISYFNEGINRGDIVALLTLKGELIGLAKALMSSNEIKQNDKGLAFQPTRIVMERGIYPRAWKSSGKYKKHGDGNAGGGI
ncbi:RNA-guided pseudouridylation complex pseudouridine synthase subunit Cbf5 [Caldisphaera sp.]|uniref:RNA-guided pseudouridylation complex pseudouridine synthase subunit Cbf5 n=1 Tax=Caldisphaera sp. TaxID=2060322 RepID=UPI00397C136E